MKKIIFFCFLAISLLETNFLCAQEIPQHNYKGIILAGGSGTRLFPATKTISKQLLPVYDKPVIYYPLSTLMEFGIREILIISTPRDLPAIQALLGDGSQLGLKLQYAIQEEPKGIAQAFTIGEDFIADGNVCLILGDNIFSMDSSLNKLKKSLLRQSDNTASIFAYRVSDPERFGVVEFDAQQNAISIEEKPKNPKSNYAAVGLYFYPADVVQKAKNLTPSARGELEITDINRQYLEEGRLHVIPMSRGVAWLDAGTPDSLMEASQFVQIMEQRQGQKLACIEEIAYRNKFIDDEQMQKCIDSFKDGTPYKNYLINVFREQQELRQAESKQPKIKVIETGIRDLYILEPKIFTDNRGYFFESFNENDFKILGLDYVFIQDNQSKSVYGTIRGLHLQKGNAAQAKLVRVLQGKILDVAVDLRPNSPTYGKYFSVELTADNQRQLLIPRGFAHGFSVLSDTAIVAYKCDNEYRKDCETSIRYNDPDLGIDWQIPAEDVIISDKDANAVTFQQFKTENNTTSKNIYKKQKILVTGANGQLAQELRAILGDSAYYVTHSELDISNEIAVQNFFKEKSFDWVINCAAYTRVDDAEDHPEECDAVNHLGALYLAKYGKNIIHISTDYVFDGNSRKPYKETAKTNPKTVYGKTKLAGEKAVLTNAKTAVVIRTSWLYSNHGKNFVKAIERLADEHPEISVVTDQTGSPTYAADLAQIIVEILPKIQPATHEIYHFSNEGQTSRYEFAQEILRLNGSTCKVAPTTSAKFPSRASRPSYSTLDTAKIKKDFGIKNSNWKESLQSCLQH